MKKLSIFLAMGILMAVSAFSQSVPPWTEDFDGTVSFTATPAGSWSYDTMYYLPGSSTTNPRSYLGLVPNRVGDTTILQTPPYDCSSYDYVVLRFNHICKVSPLDTVRIEYRTSVGSGMSKWESIPLTSYLGNAVNFSARGFSAASYSKWQAEDSTVFPSQSWWREEIFDLVGIAEREQIQFRFMIIHGKQSGTQASYGWLIDNFQLQAAMHQLYPPLIEISAMVKDTIYGTGPWEINAKVKSRTNVEIMKPSLIYTAMQNGVLLKTDTLLMDNVRGDSLWKASIPQYITGTTVTYFITGQDSLGNKATAQSEYVIREQTSCEAGINDSDNDYILQGNGATTSTLPFVYSSNRYSRSMSLYPVASIDQNAVGFITSVSFRVAAAGTGAFPIQLYLKTVPVSKTAWVTASDNLSWAELTQDATLVYEGEFRFGQTGWVDVPLTVFYPYTRTDNLVLMCVQNCENTTCSGYPTFFCSNSSSATANQIITKYSNTAPPVTSNSSVNLSYYRPDLRINVIPFCRDSNAAAVHSIDMNDTTFVSTPTLPVVVTIKNRGIEPLTSANIYYSINGNSPQSYSLTGVNAPWDFNIQRPIANYTPKIHGYDTIKVWIKMPNGTEDYNVNDDTLTKIIYSAYGIWGNFVSSITDTVYTTGRHEIKTKIINLMGDTLPANIPLYVAYTYQNATNYDTLNMLLDLSDDLWKVTLPHYRFGSDVVYSIKLKDKLGNDIVLSDSCYIERKTPNFLGNSVKLESLNDLNVATITAGIATPILVTIRNKGISNLDSCYINWSLNEVIQPGTTVYRGKDILEDFTDTITLVSLFTPVLGQSNIVTVWVSLPNGQTDAVTDDDTLTVSLIGCPDTGNSIINIPGNFPSVNAAVQSILDCGITGKVIWEIDQGNYTGMIDLSLLRNILTVNDTLVIRSAMGIASNVVFTAGSGTPAMRINAIRNLYVEHVTLNAALGTHGVEIIGQCDNVEINNCIINANATTTSASGGCGVYYNGNTSSPAMGNLRFLNNTITGGHSGFYFNYLNPSATVQSASTSWIRITGNTIENTYYGGIYAYYYGRFDSIAYNKINTRAVTSAQYGMNLNMYHRVNDGIIGNKIKINTTGGTSYGIFTYYFNSTTTGASGHALVANNEIRKLSSGGTFYGLINNYCHAIFIHNSVYAEGTGTNYGMYLSVTSTTHPSTIMNNLFICRGTGTTNYALHCPTVTYSRRVNGVILDYNDYYSTGTSLSNLGPTLADLQTATQQDTHSVSINPDFLNINNSLAVTNNIGITVSRIASVSEDINSISRFSSTTMGAYEILPTERDLMLSQFVSWDNEIVTGQRVHVNVDVLNLGIPFTEVKLRWSVNGAEQLPPVSWTSTQPLGSFEQATIPIGSFIATNSNTFDVVVWIETIDGQPDMAKWNDTVVAWTQLAPLAEFVAPFIRDTIGVLSFDVNVKIREGSGATINTPEMYLYIDACNSNIEDTLVIAMVKENDKWVTKLPKLYYGSRVIYEILLSDTVDNELTLRDTTYIEFRGGAPIGKRVEYLYTGGVEQVTLEEGDYQIEVWGGNGGMANHGTGPTVYTTEVGYGGYSVGTISLESATTFYVVVGGKGTDGNQGSSTGGYNGGGNGSVSYAALIGGGGGGATHIATATGILSKLDGNQSDIVIVAGGGGGSGFMSNGGNGGGINGIQPATYTQYSSRTGGGGGTQSAAGACYYLGSGAGFGQGGTTTQEMAGGGGGGWYGGCTGAQYTGGGGGSGYIGGITDGISAAVNQRYFVPNPITSGHGFVRITRLAREVSSGNNLAIFNLLSPTNMDGEMCTAFSSPVEIELSNYGENDYDFTKDSITIGYEIINPRGVIYNSNVTVDTGELLSGEAKSIELMSNLSMVPGTYTIKAYVTSGLDNFSCDDTLKTVYVPKLTALPVDEDFSDTAFAGFVSIPILGQETWSQYNDPTNQILPPDNTNGMLRYVGSFGTMAQLSTYQLDLSGVVDPKLKFWYYHDATTSDLDKSYTEVNIIVDDLPTTVLTLSRRDTASGFTGWKQYTIDLIPFTTGQCVLIQFESMNRYNTLSAQYIGHVTIISTPDLEVSEIIISPEITLCERDNKELKVVLTNIVNQNMNFVQGNSLTIQIGSQSPLTYPLTGTITGNTSNTISIASNVDLKNITNIKVWLTTPVDNHASNDTATILIDIRPSLSVTINPVTTVNNCFKKGMEINQEVVLQNTANMDIEEIELQLLIDITPPQIIRDTIFTVLRAGETTSHTFKNKYIVPGEVNYPVRVLAWMKCDSALVNTLSEIQECVDMNNISVLSIDNPLEGQTDTVGSTNNIVITVKNESDNRRYMNVTVMALIENEQGIMTGSRLGTISVVEPLDTVQLTFTEKYTIPNDSMYFIKVYLNSMDIYPEDDTLTTTCYTRERDTTGTTPPGINQTGKGNVFTLGQNIPNPANNSTLINYSIPEAGEVIFHVHSISGQLLYSKTIETEHGNQSIKLNTSTFAAGVYFYSIEYKGQKLVKRMNVQ